jgi:hypothetical protein
VKQELRTGYEAVWWSREGLDENEMINHWGVHVAMMPLLSIASSAGLKGGLWFVRARVRDKPGSALLVREERGGRRGRIGV